MVLLGYFLFVIVGLSLALLGSGGAILTIPILIYVLHVPVGLSTTYSLLIVGVTALLGMFRNRQLISYSRALLFSIPSIAGVVFSRRVILPHLPKQMGFLSRDEFLIALLIVIMVLASYFMITGRNYAHGDEDLTTEKALKISLSAISLGILMGLLGAGGGFMIVPTLVLWLGFEMKQAVATSLFIVALNSLAGFAVDAHPLNTADYHHMLSLIVCTAAGMGIGAVITQRIPSEKLKYGFGWFIAIVAFSIGIREFLFS